jgi:hypothetical protein
MIRIAIAATWLALACMGAHAQDISGTWQGRTTDQRVVKITKTAGGYRGEIFYLGDEGATLNGNPLTAIRVKDGTVHFEGVRRFGVFAGKFSPTAIPSPAHGAPPGPQSLSLWSAPLPRTHGRLILRRTRSCSSPPTMT